MVFDYGRADVERTQRESQKYQYGKIKERLEKEGSEKKERQERIKSAIGKYSKITSKLHSPVKASKMSYKTSNPLKKLLSNKNRATIRVGGY